MIKNHWSLVRPDDSKQLCKVPIPYRWRNTEYFRIFRHIFYDTVLGTWNMTDFISKKLASSLKPILNLHRSFAVPPSTRCFAMYFKIFKIQKIHRIPFLVGKKFCHSESFTSIRSGRKWTSSVEKALKRVTTRRHPYHTLITGVCFVSWWQ